MQLLLAVTGVLHAQEVPGQAQPKAAPEVSQIASVNTKLPVSPGTRLFFRAQSTDHPMRPMMEENFTLEIMETWTSGVTFKYEIAQMVIGEESGIQSLSSMDTCAAIDPWWDPGETSHDDRCEFWIPAKVYRELVVNHISYLAVDTLMRRDSVVRWELKERTSVKLELNGRPVRVDALVIQTSRNDKIVVLDDPANPLILGMESFYFAWELVSVSN